MLVCISAALTLAAAKGHNKTAAVSQTQPLLSIETRLLGSCALAKPTLVLISGL